MGYFFKKILIFFIVFSISVTGIAGGTKHKGSLQRGHKKTTVTMQDQSYQEKRRSLLELPGPRRNPCLRACGEATISVGTAALCISLGLVVLSAACIPNLSIRPVAPKLVKPETFDVNYSFHEGINYQRSDNYNHHNITIPFKPSSHDMSALPTGSQDLSLYVPHNVHPGMITVGASKLDYKAHLHKEFAQLVEEDACVINEDKGTADCYVESDREPTYILDGKRKRKGLFEFNRSAEAWRELMAQYGTPEKKFTRDSFSTFFKQSNDDFLAAIKGIHHVLLRGSFEQSSYRSWKNVALLARNDSFPALSHIDQWQSYISRHVPHLQASFEQVQSIAQNLSSHVERTPELKNFFSNSVQSEEASYEQKMTAAIYWIALSHEFHHYPVLSENFVFVPSFSTEEYDALLLEMGQTILKLYDESPVKAAAYAHERFVRIRPFEKHNGGIARMLCELILMSGGYEPVLFFSRDAYLLAVRSFVAKENYLPLETLDSLKEQHLDFQSTPFLDFLHNALLTQRKHEGKILGFLKKLFNCSEKCEAKKFEEYLSAAQEESSGTGLH